jgi:hypothetical protein
MTQITDQKEKDCGRKPDVVTMSLAWISALRNQRTVSFLIAAPPLCVQRTDLGSAAPLTRIGPWLARRRTSSDVK